MTQNFLDWNQYPPAPGVYIMKDIQGQVLYIGKAKNLRNRIKQYFKGQDQRPMIPYLLSHLKQLDWLLVSDEKEALILENHLIKSHQPKYNILLKNDKGRVYLGIDLAQEWPRVEIIRSRNSLKKGWIYFGPYGNYHGANRVLSLVHRLFPLRRCTDHELRNRVKACLLHQMKRCIAPCVNLCTKEHYSQLVSRLEKFLKGNVKQTLEELSFQIEDAIEKLEFERASEISKIKEAIEHEMEDYFISEFNDKNVDFVDLLLKDNDIVIGHATIRQGRIIHIECRVFEGVCGEIDEILEAYLFQYYKGEQLRIDQVCVPLPQESVSLFNEILQPIVFSSLLSNPQERLQNMIQKNLGAHYEREKGKKDKIQDVLWAIKKDFRLQHFPKKIECIDISHHQGAYTVGALIAYENGKKSPSGYRKFKMKSPASQKNDYHSIQEVLFRQYRRDKGNPLPDLIIIDGGLGHFKAAKKILEEIDLSHIDLISISKEESKHTKGLTQETIFFEEGQRAQPHLYSPVLLLLQQIRDEAHRFAIIYHRKLRDALPVSP